MEDQVRLDEKVVSEEELQKVREELPKNKKIVEIEEKDFKTVTRMQG